MKPVVDGLAKEYEGKVEFRRYNAEKDPEAVQLANEMGITAVPTFIFVNSDGVQAGTKLGGGTAQEFRTLIDKLQ